MKRFLMNPKEKKKRKVFIQSNICCHKHTTYTTFRLIGKEII